MKRQRPGSHVTAVAGPASRRLADEFIEDLASRGVTGFWEPVLQVNFLRQLLARLERRVAARPPDAVICVDYYGFNRRVLEMASRQGVPAFYFVSPQIWASRPGRMYALKRLVRRMLVIFPFEERLYREAGVPVTFVGHPLLDAVPEPARPRVANEVPTIGILPGSRASELKRHLSVCYDAFTRLRAKHPMLRGLLFATAAHADQAYGALPPGVDLVRDHDYSQRRTLDVAICSSGTATLENALLGIPMVVIYKLSWPTYLVARTIVTVRDIAMVNLLAGKRLVPELIQRAASPARIAAAAAEILDDPDKAAVLRRELLALRSTLGEPGAADRAARVILGELA